MSIHQILLLTVFGVLQLLIAVVTGSGYNYDRPVPNSPQTGHIFQPLATILPLPPVPSLPPLPTPRPRNINSIIASYLPAQNTQPNQFSSNPALLLPPPRQTAQIQPQQQQPRISPTYLTPTPQRPANAPQSTYRQQVTPTFDLRADVPSTAGTLATLSIPTAASLRFFGPSGSPQAPTAGGFVVSTPQAPSVLFAPSAASGPATPLQAVPQPLRIPFGKAAVISLPSPDNSDIYLGPNGRQLKQYAVIEIIDNDIEQRMQPFLPAGYFDSARTQIDASGAGATSADPGAVQLVSRVGPLVQTAQAFPQQPDNMPPQPQTFTPQPQQNGRSLNSNAISLGSGGLGYVRLPNGNVYLGSGSLGYISNQQHQQYVQEARTRTGARQPDALHFGHGALGGTTNNFAFRFK